MTYSDFSVTNALSLWDLPDTATARLINISENRTYLIEDAGEPLAVLRVHREGYHSWHQITCELAWLSALRDECVVPVADVFLGRDGQAIQIIGENDCGKTIFAVLFEFLEGQAPSETGNLTLGFQSLGVIAAKCHDHVQSWRKPDGFDRMVWDESSILDSCAIWGDWREAPQVTSEVKTVLQRAEDKIRERLERYGKGADRFNLIHADMRLANLLVQDDQIRVIDFDDCGFGWLMYDFAAAISFIEDSPDIPTLKSSWLKGYRSVRALSKKDEQEIETFIMLRRLALLAWVGSRSQSTEPQQLANGFAATTAKLGMSYLDWAARLEERKL